MNRSALLLALPLLAGCNMHSKMPGDDDEAVSIKADESGNLVFRKTARNFNLPAATCGKVCVAEVEEIVPIGSLDPDCIHLPSIYVNRMILGAPYDKKIEFTTTRERESA